jgi:hypothetical protein
VREDTGNCGYINPPPTKGGGGGIFRNSMMSFWRPRIIDSPKTDSSSLPKEDETQGRTICGGSGDSCKITGLGCGRCSEWGHEACSGYKGSFISSCNKRLRHVAFPARQILFSTIIVQNIGYYKIIY